MTEKQSERVASIRQAFPILNQTINDEPLIYFDNAATTQKPEAMVQALTSYYYHDNANSHRGVHTLAMRATEQFEATRSRLASRFGVESHEILFNSGTTEGLNQIAFGLVMPQLSPSDTVLVTVMEHHSNLVPWQQLCQATGAQLKYVPIDPETFIIDLEALEELLVSNEVKAIAVNHVSNVIGVEQPIQAISQLAHQYGSLVIVDGAQAVAHLPVNIAELAVDAYCFSAHKVYGPTGLGVCYLNEKHHQRTHPFKFGGEMINYVGDYKSDFKSAPWKFEAGTQPIAQVVAFGATLEFLDQIDLKELIKREAQLTRDLLNGLSQIPGVTVYGDKSPTHHGIVSFNIDGIHPHDAATAYDLEGIALRAGHHCAQPLMRYLNEPATLRASLGIYNTPEEIQRFLTVTNKIKEYFTHGFR